MTDLTPGPEMDSAVTEALDQPIPDWSPSTDIAHTIEALEATGRCFWIYNDPSGLVGPPGLFGPYTVNIAGCGTAGKADTLPEAACRAILAWAEVKEKNDA